MILIEKEIGIYTKSYYDNYHTENHIFHALAKKLANFFSGVLMANYQILQLYEINSDRWKKKNFKFKYYDNY